MHLISVFKLIDATVIFLGVFVETQSRSSQTTQEALEIIRLQDFLYLDRWTKYFQCYWLRDLHAMRAAKHTDLEQISLKLGHIRTH